MVEVKQDKQTPERFSTFAFYWRAIVKAHPRPTLAIVLLMIASSVLGMVTIGLAVPLLDALTDPQRLHQSRFIQLLIRGLSAFHLPQTSNAVIFSLLAVACVLFILNGALSVLHQFATAAVALRLRRETKMALFARFLRAPYEDVSSQARGAIIHHINQPSETIHMAIINLGQLTAGMFDCAVMVGMMVYLSWWATLLVGFLAVSGVFGWRRFSDKNASAYGRVLYETRAEQSKMEVDAIDGLRVVKAHGLEGLMVGRQQGLLDAETKPTLGLAFFKYAPGLVNEVIACVMTLGLGSLTFLWPSLGIRFSMLVTFLLAVRRIAPAMARVSSSWIELNRFRRSLEVAEEILKTLPQERKGGTLVGPVSRIELNALGFTYRARPELPVLQNVSAVLERGKITAVVGPSGAGKSSLISLLLGLHPPTQGSIEVNGSSLQNVDLHGWRKHVGYVSQDLFVFNATVRENIALGEPLTDDEIVSAASIAQLHEFISSMPQGYDTVVGDRGLRLSGGQCQRLAIARAVVRRPDVLIFDEATSALDNLTEQAVYEAIRTLRTDAVVAVVAHRLSTVRDADQILVLQNGRLAESGNHPELMAKHGLYARLYEEDAVGQRQRAEAEVAA